MRALKYVSLWCMLVILGTSVLLIFEKTTGANVDWGILAYVFITTIYCTSSYENDKK